MNRAFYSRCVRLANDVAGLLGYPRRRFLDDIEISGPVEAVRKIIHSDKPSSTFCALWERGYGKFGHLSAYKYLDKTVEAMVITEREWDDSFSDADRAAALKRLRDHGWKPPSER